MRLDAIETLSPLPLGTQIAALPSVTESHYILADQRQVWQAPLRATAQEARKLVVEDWFDAPSDRAFTPSRPPIPAWWWSAPTMTPPP